MTRAFDRVNWRITSPPSEATYFDGKLPADILNKVVKGAKGSRITILQWNGYPILDVPFTGTTFKAFMNSIYRGLNAPINPNKLNAVQSCKVYEVIGAFARKEDRLKLVGLFEDGNLTAKELVGNYIYFEGGLKKRNGVWYYNVGS